jgi:hypothetical protein
MRTFKLRNFALRRRPNSAARTVMDPSFSIVGLLKLVEGVGRVAKKKLSWDASPSPGVAGYRIYWGCGKPVDYDSQFVDVGKMTALVLPDDIPSFPRVTGKVEIGITAVSERGNESDMHVLSAFLDFARPCAPRNLKLINVALEGKSCLIRTSIF